jgi:hypothetical protein
VTEPRAVSATFNTEFALCLASLDRAAEMLAAATTHAMTDALANAHAVAGIRRRALVLARGRDLLAVEVRRLLSREILAAHDFTASLAWRALDGDAEALDEWRGMLDEPDLADFAAEVLDLAARVASTVTAVGRVVGDLAEVLAGDVVAGAVAHLAAEVDADPPRIVLAGSVQAVAPPARCTRVPAATGQRIAMHTGRPPTD